MSGKSWKEREQEIVQAVSALLIGAVALGYVMEQKQAARALPAQATENKGASVSGVALAQAVGPSIADFQFVYDKDRSIDKCIEAKVNRVLPKSQYSQTKLELLSNLKRPIKACLCDTDQLRIYVRDSEKTKIMEYFLDAAREVGGGSRTETPMFDAERFKSPYTIFVTCL